MGRAYNSVCWMNYPQILNIPQKLLSIDFRLVYWELFRALNYNRVKLHGIEQFPDLGSLTLPVLSNHGKPETPWSSAWPAVYADQRRRKVTFDQFLWPIYHYANCCNVRSWPNISFPQCICYSFIFSTRTKPRSYSHITQGLVFFDFINWEAPDHWRWECML